MNRSTADPVNIHATCVELACAGHTLGVLLMGESGCGKSSLALRLIDRPGTGTGSDIPIIARLISDDQVLLTGVEGGLTAFPPDMTRGLLEVRGIGIVKVQAAGAPVRIGLAVTHTAMADQERMPDARDIELAGCSLPLYEVDFSTPSADAYIRVLAQMQWGLTSLINR